MSRVEIKDTICCSGGKWWTGYQKVSSNYIHLEDKHFISTLPLTPAKRWCRLAELIGKFNFVSSRQDRKHLLIRQAPRWTRCICTRCSSRTVLLWRLFQIWNDVDTWDSDTLPCLVRTKYTYTDACKVHTHAHIPTRVPARPPARTQHVTYIQFWLHLAAKNKQTSEQTE